MSTAPQEPSSPESREDGGPSYAGMPAWVKWFLVAALVLGVLLLVALLTGGEHGPGRHMYHSPAEGLLSLAAAAR